MLVAIANKELSSNIGLKGIFKKVCIIILVAVATLICDYLLGDEFVPIRTVVIFFYIANEGLSIIENAALPGVPVPKKLKEVLKKVRNEETEEKK